MNAVMQRENTGPAVRAETRPGAPVFSPNVDILENADELTLFADVPGVGSESIDIQYEHGELSIRGKVPAPPSVRSYLLNEYAIGDFYRVFQLGEGIDNAKITAEVSNGVLTVHLPKVERAKPRRISVQGK